MPTQDHPTLAAGKICYLQIPAFDIQESASFYSKVFGWKIRKRTDGSLAFDDAVNEVSGTWVTGRKPDTEPGILVFMLVDDIYGAIDAIIENGGKLVQAPNDEAPEMIARFRDPAGNMFGIFQQ